MNVKKFLTRLTL